MVNQKQSLRLTLIALAIISLLFTNIAIINIDPSQNQLKKENHIATLPATNLKILQASNDQNLSASFTYATAGLTVTFTETSSKGDVNITTWQWDFNNDSIIDSTEQHPTYTYSSYGTYQVSLTIIDEADNTSSTYQIIPVYHYYVSKEYTSSTPGYNLDKFSTIDNAVAAVSTNESIFIFNGEYHEKISISTSVYIKGNNEHNVRLLNDDDVITITAPYVTIDSISILRINDYASGDTGIIIHAAYNTITNCHIYDKHEGIYVSSHHYTIQHTTFTNITNVGILCSYTSKEGTIHSVDITNATNGIMMYGHNSLTEKNSIQQSTITNCNTGLYLLFHMENSSVINNTFSHNDNGIIIIISEEGSNNIIKGNIITQHSKTGINFSQATEGFIIYHNSFSQNTVPAYDTGSNLWYDPDLEEGNYWDDYDGPDDNNDNIGDIPYDIIGGTNKDLYPLIDDNTNINHSPYEPSDPTPANESIDQFTRLDLTWIGGDPDEDDVVIYDIYLGTNLDPPLYLADHKTTSLSVTDLSYDTTYYWKVVSFDSFNRSTEGPIWQFTTIMYDNHPPYEPHHPYPNNFQKNLEIDSLLTWYGGDPDYGDYVEYDVYFSASYPPELIVQGVEGESYDPGLLSYNTQYYWIVIARDSHGSITAGPLWQFTTSGDTNNPPFTPSLPNPYHEETDVSVTASLSWVGGDPDGHDVSYDVYLNSSEPPTKIADDISQPWYTPDQTFEYETTYYWKIVATDELGKTSTSPLWNFTIGEPENHQPLKPNNPYPEDESDDISAPIIQFSWNAEDPDDDPLHYSIYIGKNNSNPTMLLVSNLTESEYVYENLSSNTSYVWRIYVYDHHGALRIGPIWSFETSTIENQPPNKPGSPSPAHKGKMNIVHEQVLSWSCSDPDDDVLVYDIYLGTDSSPDKIKSNHNKTRYTIINNLSNNTTYFWRIVAKDAHGGQTRGTLWNFTTYKKNNTPPITPKNPFPGDEAKHVSRMITLEWENGDEDENDTVSYDVYFDDINPPTEKVATVTTEYYALSKLSYNNTYYWQIVAKDNYSATSTSPVWMFSTKNSSDLPVAIITGPDVGFVDEELEFSAADSYDPDGNISTYSWSFDDQKKAIGISTSHIFQSANNYTITLTVTDNDAETHSVTKQVAISDANRPPSNPDIEGERTTSSNTSYSILVSSTDEDGDQIKFVIDWGDGSTDKTGFVNSGQTVTQTNTFTNPNELMKIKVYAEDDKGQQSGTEEFTVYVQADTYNSDSTNDDNEDTGDGFNWWWLLIPVLLVLIVIIYAIFQSRLRKKQQEERLKEKELNYPQSTYEIDIEKDDKKKDKE